MTTTVSESIAIRDVEVRTWPERADLLVIDINRALPLAHYPLDPEAGGPLHDVLSSYEDRSQAALGALQRDQDYLRAHYRIEPSEEVKLRPISDTRSRIEELLAEHGLSLATTTIAQLRSAFAHLQAMPIEQLYTLLCDWFDSVERHYPAGSSRLDPDSWVHRAAPDCAYQFHYLACGLKSRDEAVEGEPEEAYALFRSLIDVPLENFSFGHFLRWVYFHRTEFAAMPGFEMRALAATAAP